MACAEFRSHSLHEVLSSVVSNLNLRHYDTGEAAASISSVLLAMRVPEEYAVGTLRLSVGRHTTAEDVERGAELIAAAAGRQMDEIAAMPEGERPWWCVRNYLPKGGKKEEVKA